MPSERASAPPQLIVDVPIRGDTIRLGQLLKLAGEIDSGAEVKALLAGGAVIVNGEPESRRGASSTRATPCAPAGARSG